MADLIHTGEGENDIRGEATGAEIMAAVKLALESRPLAGHVQVLNLIAWLMEVHDPEPSRGTMPTKLFVEAIKETRV